MPSGIKGAVFRCAELRALYRSGAIDRITWHDTRNSILHFSSGGRFREASILWPYERVRRALVRASRERWLSRTELNRIGMAFAECSGSGNPTVTLGRALDGFGILGMLDGAGLLPEHHPRKQYLSSELLFLERKKRDRSVNEVEALNAMVRSLK